MAGDIHCYIRCEAALSSRIEGAQSSLSDLLRRTERSLTMKPEELLKARRDEILNLCARYGARNVRVFGSVARGEADESSDIDLIVDFEPERSLFDHAGLWLELQELAGIKVDVVSSRGLKPRIRERVLQEAVPL